MPIRRKRNMKYSASFSLETLYSLRIFYNNIPLV